MIRHARVQTEEQLARALEDATGRPAVVFYTLVDSALREAIVDLARQHRIVTLDVLSPALHAITTASGTQATMLARAYRAAGCPVLPPDRGHRVCRQARRRPRLGGLESRRDRAGRRLADVEDADVDAPGLSRLHGRQRADRAWHRSAPGAVLGRPVEGGRAHDRRRAAGRDPAPGGCGRWPPVRTPGTPTCRRSTTSWSSPRRFTGGSAVR